MSDSKVRVAVVGLGLWGECHVETLAAMAGVEVVAVSDAYAPRLEEVANKYNVAGRYETPEAIWQRDDIDLVSIVTPVYDHCHQVVDALKSGKHVLVEKAVTLKAEEARTMQQAADDSGKFLMPAHILRFDTRYAAIKRHLEEDAIGNIVSLYSKRARPQWQLKHHGKTHTAFVLMPHDIDLSIWWTGSKVKRVRAHELRVRPELRVTETDSPDVLWATLEFENGTLAQLQSSFLLPEAARIDMGDVAEVIGEKGVLSAQTSDGGFSWFSDTPGQQGRHSPDFGIHSHVAGRVTGALREELTYFTECIRRNEAPSYLPFSDAVHGVEVGEAILQSARSGQDVTL